MASEEPFNYHSGSWLLLSHIILSQTCSKLRNDSIEDSEVENSLEKMDFVDLVKDAKSVAGFFSLPPISSRMEKNKHSLAAKTVSKWWPLKSIFQDEFLQDSRHFRG